MSTTSGEIVGLLEQFKSYIDRKEIIDRTALGNEVNAGVSHWAALKEVEI